MTHSLKRIGVLTGGGDCPGLNGVIRAVTKGAIAHGIDAFGIEDGYLGLIEDRVRPLRIQDVAGILEEGGTILGTSNKANPKKFAVGEDANGKPIFADVSSRCLDTLAKWKLDALVCIGGDGTMAATASLLESGRERGLDLNCVGVPKTIDNDLYGTERTFGFSTAVSVATDALDRVRTTAASHHRVMVVEVMGRNAGWIALHAGVAGAANIILLPEIPFNLDIVVDYCKERGKIGKKCSVVCVAEGATPKGGSQIVARVDLTSPDPIRLGGVAKWLADQIEDRSGIESRFAVLGHVQRGGTPVPADRILATQFGHHALRMLIAGQRNRMVGIQGERMTDVAIEDVAGRQRPVDPSEPLIAAARSVATCFGDEIGFLA
jgi:6-phosphofructokinase 1